MVAQCYLTITSLTRTSNSTPGLFNFSRLIACSFRSIHYDGVIYHLLHFVPGDFWFLSRIHLYDILFSPRLRPDYQRCSAVTCLGTSYIAASSLFFAPSRSNIVSVRTSYCTVRVCLQVPLFKMFILQLICNIWPFAQSISYDYYRSNVDLMLLIPTEIWLHFQTLFSSDRRQCP